MTLEFLELSSSDVFPSFSLEQSLFKENDDGKDSTVLIARGSNVGSLNADNRFPPDLTTKSFAIECIETAL